MIDKAYDFTELTLRSVIGEQLTYIVYRGKQLTDDEKRYAHERNAKYELVRYLYTEKVRHDGIDLKNFQFSPGDSFMDAPIIDIVNGLLKVNEAIKNGNYEVADFGDSNRKHNPPHSGKEKTAL